MNTRLIQQDFFLKITLSSYHALKTFGFPGLANIPAMQNQQMMSILFEFARNILHQTILDFPDILARCKSCSI